MGITRRTQFGFPPPAQVPSTYTSRQVPLTGVNLGPWPLAPQGSSTSLVNLLPIDGMLIPRSRLSSLNTISTVLVGRGMAELPRADSASPAIWASGSTIHGILTSNGSVSRASFVSSFGLGVGSLAAQSHYQYSFAFSGNLNENILLAAPGASYDTIQCLYQAGGVASGLPLYSYLTSAPKAKCVGTFDSYVVAFNVGPYFATRVQWCVRGNPSNWTSEGSGYEDLLSMRGTGAAVKGSDDGRMILFSDAEIWYALSATYPAQFQFAPLDTSVGCPYPQTIATNCELGMLFIGSDNALRILPKGGGLSQIVAPTLTKHLRRAMVSITPAADGYSWGVYDPTTKLYYLSVAPTAATTYLPLVVNVATGDWGFLEYGTGLTPSAGIAITLANTAFTGNEGLIWINSTATFFSTSSRLGPDTVSTGNSTVTAKWQSTPIASDLAGNWKQLTQIDYDYRSTSSATLTEKISQDGGNTYESTGRTVALPRKPLSGRATSQMYIGGAFPTIELTSTSTGFELHRLDVSMNVAGRK